MLLLPLRNPPLVTAAGSHPAGLSQGPDLPVQGVPGTGELSPVLASDSSPQLQHGGTPRVWPLERLLTPHLHGNVPTWGFCSVNKIYHPPTCKEPPTQGAAPCPCGSAGYHPWGAVGGISLSSPPHPKVSPEGRAAARCAQRRAGFADSAAHALCKRPPAAAPAAVCSGCIALFAFRGITMEGDGLSAAGKWGKAAPGTCPKDPPASALLQPLPGPVQAAQWLQPISKTQIKSSTEL